MPASTPRRPRSLPRRLLREYRRAIFWVAGAVLVGLGILWWYGQRPNQNRWTLSTEAGIRLPMRYAVHGIDVSKFQGKVDWQRVRQMRLGEEYRVEFAFIKATEGQTLADRAFRQNWAGARQAGLRRGAYHFYLPFRDPVKQANHFVKTVKLEKGDLAPVLDVEINSLKPDREIVRDLETWLSLVERHYGIRPIIYTNPFFYQKFIRGNFDDYPLWIADYSNDRLTGYPSGQVLFWQHSKRGWCTGIAGSVDFNAFLFDEKRLNSLCLE